MTVRLDMPSVEVMEDGHDFTEEMERADEFANWLGKMQGIGAYPDIENPENVLPSDELDT